MLSLKEKKKMHFAAFWIAKSLDFNFLCSRLQDTNNNKRNFNYSISWIKFSIVSSEQNYDFSHKY